jgi:hypothetical protein
MECVVESALADAAARLQLHGAAPVFIREELNRTRH